MAGDDLDLLPCTRPWVSSSIQKKKKSRGSTQKGKRRKEGGRKKPQGWKFSWLKYSSNMPRSPGSILGTEGEEMKRKGKSGLRSFPAGKSNFEPYLSRQT